ncbi:hypothetical protein [Paraburkholderia sp. DHOC27]|uniref:hypothetical protein n=1 Tax=Paraburkholderia sp. DHOC27 TaxID=2303330 RepID=UPI000E3C252E|nr:hypothetical protein [Paraburkholderia sp. DHOC27]RFU49030.1 hypothetical protein D0B32_04220 [Paraburkholderia sp. DHOC27]
MRHPHVAVLLAVCLSSLAYGGDGTATSNGQAGNRDDEDVLKVFDGQGRYVGPLVSANDSQVVTIIVANGAVIAVPLSRIYNATTNQYSAEQYEWGDILSTSGQYPTPTCGGPPFIDADSPGRPSTTLRVGADATVYIAPDTESSTVTINSMGLPGQCETLGSNPSVPPVLTFEGWAAPESTYSLTQHYPEPLSVHY